jgi:trichohyalin
MASVLQTASSADWTEALPAVTLEVRQGAARSASFALDAVDFLIGSVPGCDLRLAADAPAVLCLFARHPAGATLRKLAPTQSILVNGQGASVRELADGDRVQIGQVEIQVHIAPAPQILPATGSERQRQPAPDDAKDLELRENNLADQLRTLDAKIKQYEADVLRLNRLQGDLDERETQLTQQADTLAQQREQIRQDSLELEQQLVQIDEWRTKSNDDARRLADQKQEQDALARQLAERAAALEGQQTTVAVLRGRLERMREEMRVREQQLDEQRAHQEAREAELAQKHQEAEGRHAEVRADRAQYDIDRQQWIERSAVIESAVRQLKQAQDKLAGEEERLRQDKEQLDQLRKEHADSDGVLQGRLAQLAETQARLDLERQAQQQRGVNLVQREEACLALQEQLHRRSEEIAARHKEITERLQEFQTKFAGLDERHKLLDERELDLQKQIDNWRSDLQEKAEALQKQHQAVAGIGDMHQDQLNLLAIERKIVADERAQFLVEQQAALEKLAQARAELETQRHEAQAFLHDLPDAELRAGAAVNRLSNAREQLRNHLGEIHQYVRACQDELEQLRGRLQGDLDKLQEEEQTLRRGQDEHRLAMAGFRQQLIDWQGQIGELKSLLARDETRLERKQAQVDEKARTIEVETQRLAQHAEELVEQEREVADRREEVDRHLVEMREWYRRKLRDLAGIPFMPATLKFDGEPTIPLVAPPTAPTEPAAEDGETGIVPTRSGILSLSSDQGDRKLGEVLREAQLVDGDTLTALLAEARRQRRSLRQVLLSSGVITLYQLALIETGDVQGLMLGPIRVIDRLRNSAHETVYRVFDPRRGAEAVLRHLAEGDMADALKPDEFRQRFGQARLNDPHLANTLEVLELSGRPAVLQEWLSGLPATDWPPLAAAPGVCHRLLTQAAQGLATAHHAGVIHGHLADALLLLTSDGVLKICGLGEPPWLIGIQHDDEPSARDDLRALGRIVSGWCTPTGVRKGARTKPLPEALVSVLYRLATGEDGEAGYRDVKGLLEDLEKTAGAIPANGEAWDRLLKYVREHGASEAMLRQSA